MERPVILHLEDNRQDAALVEATLRADGIAGTWMHVSTRDEFTKALDQPDIDLILADNSLPAFDGVSALEIAAQKRPEVPFIFLTGTLNEDMGIKTLRHGAVDFVPKDKLARLGPSVQRALRESEGRKARRATEEALKESELRLRELWENSPDGMQLTDADGKIVAVNEAFCRLVGLGREEAEGQLLTVISWEGVNREEALQKHRQAFSTWTVDKVIERGFTFRSGATVEVEITNSFVRFQGLRPLLLSIFRNVTDRKRAELEILKLAEFPRLNPSPVLEFAGDGTLTYFNDAALAMANSLGENHPSKFLPQDVESIVKTCLSQGQNQISLETVQGERTLAWSFYPSPASGVVHVYAEDVTERKRTEEQIREQAALLDIATDAISVHDLEQRILYWNKGAERLYGWTAAEVSGKKASELLHKPGSSNPGEALQIVRRKGEWSGEMQQITKKGKDLMVQCRWTLVRDSRSRPKSILVIATDITDKKKLETQLFRAQRLESIGTLASGVAHDLNNILSPIMMSVNLLAETFPDGPNAELLETLKCSANRGSDLVRQILTFTRGEEGARNLLNLRHLVNELFKITGETFPKTIRTRINVGRGLWPVMADATQMQQVLMNLCVNARDAMPEGGELRVEAQNMTLDEHYCSFHLEAKPGPYVALSVADNGTGIAPEILDKIFDPFFTTKEQGKGTGLGLATVLAIIKSHGGFINTYSEPGRGTRFQIFLPAVEAEFHTTFRERPAEPPLGHGERILFVDDEHAVQEITKAILQKYGYKVLTASDGTEGLALFTRHKQEIDLVMTDMMMPLMDGQSAIGALQKIDPGVRIIAISGLPDNETVTQRFSNVTFLLKPFSPEKLLSAVDQALKERTRTRAAA